jgi:hypothetical protein
VRGEKPHGGEVDRTLGEQIEDHGKPAGGASGVDAVVGLVLGQTEYVATVDEEGGIALPEVDIAGVELGEVSNELGGRLPLGGGEALQARDEIGVGEAAQGNRSSLGMSACITWVGRIGSARRKRESALNGVSNHCVRVGTACAYVSLHRSP